MKFITVSALTWDNSRQTTAVKVTSSINIDRIETVTDITAIPEKEFDLAQSVICLLGDNIQPIYCVNSHDDIIERIEDAR